MKKRVGFINLGAMGKPMARNLLKAGYILTVHDINSSSMEELKKEGAEIGRTPREVANKSDVVMTMLPNIAEIETVYFGEEGLIVAAHPQLILIDSSTIDPNSTRKIGFHATQHGVEMLDAPVGGGVPNAIKGNLIMLVGGKEATLEECRDILMTVGNRIIHVGPLGSGETLKLINNMMMGIYLFALVEGFSLAKKSGLDEEKLMTMLRENLLSFFERHTTNIRKKDFQPGFRIKLGHKDLRLAADMANSIGAPIPFGALVKEMLQMAANKGLGEFDWTAVCTLYDNIGSLE